MATTRRQYSTSSPPAIVTTRRCGVDRLGAVEARAHRQVLEHGRKPQLAELRALGSHGDQVEFGERLLARAGLEQQHLDAGSRPPLERAAEPDGERGAGIAAADDDDAALGVGWRTGDGG